MRAAVFLDRDGVINRAFVRDGVPHPPDSGETLEILPQVPQALESLKSRGYALIVVTNQPDVARGVASRESIDIMHERLARVLPLDAILSCFHDGTDECSCRKPRPGLLLRAAHDLNVELASSFMIGDRWRDMEAGRRAGCRTLFVDNGYGERAPGRYDFRVASLFEAAGIILAAQDSI